MNTVLDASPLSTIEAARAAEPTGDGLDLIALLRRDMGRQPLLTAEQEHALVLRTSGADVRVPPPGEARPTPEEARNRLLEQNLGLVISMARRYRRSGVPLEDLIQEGVLGLFRAIEGFDPSRGNRFSTYAVWWLKEAMSKAAGLSDAVQPPKRAAALRARVAWADNELTVRLGRSPSAAETGEYLDIPSSSVEEARRAQNRVASLHAPTGTDDDVTLLDTLVDPSPSPEQATEQRALRHELASALALLPPMERGVLALRFGVVGGESRSHHEVALRVGVSVQRVRHLEVRGLQQLRVIAARGNLTSYAAC